jgi:crotonobetainyl-CoA:carnitine CoA-transferase CaiB-like acyl-CoA transferase
LGDPLLYRRLHQGHELARHSFSSIEGRRDLARIVRAADVVIESSRPRALAQLGLCPEEFLSERAGRSWISITGYGREGDRSNYVAYGDDAAVSAGLVAWADPDTPVFCADAVADPLGGLFAAVGGLVSMAAGGGFLVNVSLSGAGAQVREGPICAVPHPVEREADGGWLVRHEGLTQRVLSPAEAVAAARV